MQDEEFWTPAGAHYLRDRLAAEQNHRCAYCGFVMLPQRGGKSRRKTALFQREATIDEVVPRCWGGPRSWANTVAACRWCNEHRGNVPAEVAYERIRRLVERGSHPHVQFAETGRFPRLLGLRTIMREEAPE